MKNDKKIIDCDFELLKPIGEWEVGKVFKSFGGIVSGVNEIDFLNKEYFKPVNIEYI